MGLFIEEVQNSITLPKENVRIRFFTVQCATSGKADIETLAAWLMKRLVAYALNGRKIPANLTIDQAVELFQKAAFKFRKIEGSGESGELLLYCFLEAFDNAPQAIAKMEYKPNNNVEVLGADAIHYKWNPTANSLSLVFGESKVYEKLQLAMTESVKSLDETLSPAKITKEIDLILKQPNKLDASHLAALQDQQDGKTPKITIQHHGAILVIYTEPVYASLKGTPPEMTKEIQAHLESKREALSDEISTRIATMKNRTVNHELSVFFMPVDSASRLRDEIAARLQNG
jgi:hypothetical protein